MMNLSDYFADLYKEEVTLIENSNEITRIKADLQLRSGSLENNAYGFHQNEKVRMFCGRNDNVKPGVRVKYKENFYLTESVTDGELGMIADLRRCGSCEN